MAGKIETLNAEIKRLTELNQSLVRSCQQMEIEISEMRENKMPHPALIKRNTCS